MRPAKPDRPRTHHDWACAPTPPTPRRPATNACSPSRSRCESKTLGRQFHLAAALAGDHRHYLFGEHLHLLLDLLWIEAAQFEPAHEAEVVVAALGAHLHDLVDDELLGTVDGDPTIAQHVGGDLLVEVEHRLIEPRHHR